MQVDIIDSYDAFITLEANWTNVYQKDIEAQFFLSWIWFSRVFQQYPKEWRVLAVRSGQQGDPYVGFFPLSFKTVWSKRKNRFRNEINMAGTLFWGQYTGFICDPIWEDKVIPNFAKTLMQLHWSRLSLKYLYASDKRISLFMSEFPADIFQTSEHERWINNGTTNNLLCPFIALPSDFDTYMQTCLSPNTRQKIRRYMRKFEKSQDLYISITTEDTLQRDLDILVELWMQKWIDLKGHKTKSLARMYRLILQHGFECNSLYMPILWRDEKPLGMLANFIDWQKRSVFFFVSARDEQNKEPYVGLVLHALSIRWAIENGFNTYDFCHGDEAYKYSFGATDRILKHLVVRTRSGINLHGMLDPGQLGDVMEQIIKLIEKNSLSEAKIGCQQVRDVSLE